MKTGMKTGTTMSGALVLALAAIVGGSAAAAEPGRAVGFQIVQVPDAGGPAFPAGVWYPTTATPANVNPPGRPPMVVAKDGPVGGGKLPLVVISHGNGAGIQSHADLALALAAAGYVVVAPMHPGDNAQDQSRIGAAGWLADRNRQLNDTTDYMLDGWPQRAHVDARRIGAYGFSAGGFTVLAAVGAQPDLGAIATHCASQPEFVCRMLADLKSPLLDKDAALPAPRPDPRIRAAVVAAPGLAFTMAGKALDPVTVPVQLWAADQDVNVPVATNAKVVRDGLGARVEYHGVPGAGHLSFLTPCPGGPAPVCTDPDGFDRAAFHARMNADVVRFFDRTLAPR